MFCVAAAAAAAAVFRCSALLPCCAGARPRDWLRSPGAGGGGWGALRASAAPRRVSQHSDQEAVVEAEDDDEEEEERVAKFDPAASTAAGRVIRFVPRDQVCAAIGAAFR